MLKYFIITMSLLSFMFSQNLIETKEFKVTFNSDLEQLNIMELINEASGTFKVQLIKVEMPFYKRSKQILIQPCELEFNISSDLSKEKIDYKLCENKIVSIGSLLVDKSNPYIFINNEKFKIFEGIFSFYISGIFTDAKKSNKENHGLLREWFDNGVLKLEYSMTDGIKNGICKRWYKNGQIDIMYNYNNGKLEGIQKKWYKNGKIRAEWSYINDKLHGSSIEYASDGLIISKRYYENGTLLDEKTFN